MRKKSGRTVRTVGGALALALGAGVVLGTVPANADWSVYPIQLGYHGLPLTGSASRSTASGLAG